MNTLNCRLYRSVYFGVDKSRGDNKIPLESAYRRECRFWQKQTDGTVNGKSVGHYVWGKLQKLMNLKLPLKGKKIVENRPEDN